MPGWLHWLSIWLLVSAQVMISVSWVQAPCWAQRWQHGACLRFSLSLSLSPSLSAPHPLTLFLSLSKNKLRKNPVAIRKGTNCLSDRTLLNLLQSFFSVSSPEEIGGCGPTFAKWLFCHPSLFLLSPQIVPELSFYSCTSSFLLLQ